MFPPWCLVDDTDDADNEAFNLVQPPRRPWSRPPVRRMSVFTSSLPKRDAMGGGGKFLSISFLHLYFVVDKC